MEEKVRDFLNSDLCEADYFNLSKEDLINLKEYRNLDGYSKDKKRGSTRFDRVPIELVDEIVVDDYHMFVPFDNEFTSKDYAKRTKQNLSRAQTLLTILQYLKIVEVVGKDKRYNVYKKL